MATKTGTITARPTSYLYKSSSVYNVDTFLSGEADFFYNNYISSYGNPDKGQKIAFNGFDFSSLSKLQNVKVTNITVSADIEGTASSSIDYAVFGFNLVTDVTALSTYTDLGDGRISVVYEKKYTGRANHTKNEVDLPNALTWINANLEDFINGLTSNTFAILVNIGYARCYDLAITITYTYEDKSNKIYVGTAQPSKIYVDTQEVKEVYVDTTKVYG